MPLPTPLRRLDVDLPACPQVLTRMMALMQDEDASLAEMAELVEGDMALAAAVLRTVNSAMFGILRRVETVGEALRYLGMREVTAITLHTALRAAFPATPQMEALWQHAGRSGLLMGRSARALGLDAMQAHSAGLFARSGQAVLLAHAAERYGALLAALGSDRAALRAAEIEAFGVDHGAYGSALCAAWGLAPEVVHYVREQLRAPEQWPREPRGLRRLLALGAVVEALLGEDDADAAAQTLAPAGDCSGADLLAAVQAPWNRLRSGEQAAVASPVA